MLFSGFQHFSVYFSDQADGEPVLEHDLLGNGIGDQPAAARFQDLPFCGGAVGALPALDKQPYHLPLHLVGNAHGAHLGDARNAACHFLDLRRVHGNAAHLDHIFDALFEIQKTVRIHIAVVARFQPLFPVDGDEGSALFVQVAQHELIGLQKNFPHLSDGGLRALFFDAHLCPRKRVSDRIFPVMGEGVDEADGHRFRQTVAHVHSGMAAALFESGVEGIDERLRNAVPADVHVLDMGEIALRKGLFAQQFDEHGGNARQNVGLAADDLFCAHLCIEFDAHDVGAAHQHTHVHIDAQPEPVKDRQNVVERRVILQRLAEEFLRLGAQFVEHEVVVNDDLRLARGAAAGKIDGGLVHAPFCGGNAGMSAVFEILLEGNVPERRALVGAFIIRLCDGAHEIGAVADHRGNAEIVGAALVQIVHEQEAAVRAADALF